MKIKHIKIIISVAVALGVVWLLASDIKMREANHVLNNNIEVLYDTIFRYKVADSLNAVTIAELQFKKDELSRLREEDQKIIKQLTKKVKLQSVENLELKNKLQLSVVLRDTVFIHHRIPVDSAKAFTYHSMWTDINGLIYNDSIALSIENREALIITESLEKKKLGCIRLPIWMFGYKNKRIDAVSKNPNTTIESIEYINIR